MTPLQTIRMCRDYGIEFHSDPVTGCWQWRTVSDGVTEFAWQGACVNIAAAAVDCMAYCGFDD